jgi:hypothetical protein
VVSVGAGAGAWSAGAVSLGAGAGAFGLCGSAIEDGISGLVGAGSDVDIGNANPSPAVVVVIPWPDESHTVDMPGLV